MGGEHGITVGGGPYGLCMYGCVGMGGEHGISVEGGPYGLCMYGCVGMGGEHGISVEGGPYGLCMYGCVGMGGENCMSVLYSYCVNIGIFFMQIFAKWISLHLLCLFYTANLCLNANLCLIPKIAPVHKKNRDPTCLQSTTALTTGRRMPKHELEASPAPDSVSGASGASSPASSTCKRARTSTPSAPTDLLLKTSALPAKIPASAVSSEDGCVQTQDGPYTKVLALCLNDFKRSYDSMHERGNSMTILECVIVQVLRAGFTTSPYEPTDIPEKQHVFFNKNNKPLQGRAMPTMTMEVRHTCSEKFYREVGVDAGKQIRYE